MEELAKEQSNKRRHHRTQIALSKQYPHLEITHYHNYSVLTRNPQINALQKWFMTFDRQLICVPISSCTRNPDPETAVTGNTRSSRNPPESAPSPEKALVPRTWALPRQKHLLGESDERALITQARSLPPLSQLRTMRINPAPLQTLGNPSAQRNPLSRKKMRVHLGRGGQSLCGKFRLVAFLPSFLGDDAPPSEMPHLCFGSSLSRLCFGFSGPSSPDWPCH